MIGHAADNGVIGGGQLKMPTSKQIFLYAWWWAQYWESARVESLKEDGPNDRITGRCDARVNAFCQILALHPSAAGATP